MKTCCSITFLIARIANSDLKTKKIEASRIFSHYCATYIICWLHKWLPIILGSYAVITAKYLLCSVLLWFLLVLTLCTLISIKKFTKLMDFVHDKKCTYLWFVPAGNTLTALMSNCNWSCVHGVEPFLLLPVAPEPPPQARVADSISSCRSRSMRRSVSSIAWRKAVRPSRANMVTSSSNLRQ